MNYEEYLAAAAVQRSVTQANKPQSASAQKLRAELMADPTTPTAKYAREMQVWRDRLREPR